MKHARGDTPWDVEANADFDGIDAEIARPRLPFTSPTVGATTTCDLATARVFVFTVSQATTLAFTNVPAATFAVRIRLLLTNASAFLITWPASVVWLAGIKPTFKASGVDEVELLTKDAGVTWYATIRNLRSGPIYQNGLVSTTSTSEVSLASFVLPGGTLSANLQSLRITVCGQALVQSCTFKPKFGATYIDTHTPAAATSFVHVYRIIRTGAATQLVYEQATNSPASAIIPAVGGSPLETLSGNITIDFRGFVTSGGTLSIHLIEIEYLAVT